MNVRDIRPIPKYIMDRIYKIDLKLEPWQTNYVRYYAYLTSYKKELVKVTVAVTTFKNNYWACKQVAIHGIHTKDCFVRDLEYNYLGHGFRVGWYMEELQSKQKNFEDGNWYAAKTEYYDPYATLINRSVVGKFPEYKYSAYQLYNGRDIINYLRIYEQYPQTEYLLKLGLSAYAENLSLLKKITKDKAFRKWIARNRKELALPYGNAYTYTAVMQAYKTGLPIKEVSHFLFRKREFEHDATKTPIRELFKGWELKKYFDYTEKNKISDRLYLDYLHACQELGIDMSIKQNLLPKDFTYAHDLRTRQYAEKKALEEAEKKQELMRRFSEVAEKYSPLQHNKRSAFICVIPRSPADLICEGELMHHCVGRMQYDERFAKEQSLIFFIRAKDKPEKPLVTLEYSLSTHRVLQCYASHNQTPSEEVMHYVNKVWLPYANREIKKLTA